MSVTRRRLDLGVAKQPCDQRQGLAQRQRPAGKGVPEIPYNRIAETGASMYKGKRP